MSKQNNLTDFLTDVANAIRAKKGSTDLINPQNFSAEIAALSGGLEVIEMTETTVTIEPNKVYVWGMVESLDITLGTSTGENDFFAFRFRCSKPTMTVVIVNGATWADDTILDAEGKPVLDLGSWYQCEIKGGTSALYARLMHYIPFEDSNVEAVLLANGVGDGIGVTYKDAAKVTSISTWFKGNTDITSFAEFINFLGISLLAGNAFNGCSLLAEIALPASLTSIGNYAFQNCTSLSSIALPEGLTAIGQGAFVRCSALSLVIDLPNLTTLGQDAFSLADVTRVENLGKISSIEHAVSSNYGMFRGNVNLTYVNLPDTLTRIGNYAFYGCTSLAEMAFPAGITYIGSYAFYQCKSLTRVVNLENTKVTSIDQYAFRYCSSLAEITLPTGVTSIGNYAFYGCISLQYIRIKATTPPTLKSTNAIPSTIGAIYVPDESVAAYQAATNWSSFASKIKGISEMPA